MSSLPTNYKPKKGHHHKRSAAISGDFDVNYGINIFQPPTPNSLKLTPKNSDLSIDYGNDTSVDTNVAFDKEKDYQAILDFQFPSKEALNNLMKNHLNSPIKFNTYSNLNLSLHSMNSNSSFSNYSTNSNNGNGSSTNLITNSKSIITNQNKYTIPDPLIDLNEIFNKSHRKTESAPELDFSLNIDQLTTNNTLINSKLKSSLNFKKSNQFNSPKDEDFNEILEEDENENEETKTSFSHKNYTAKKLYNNLSQNSSTVSFVVNNNSSNQSLNSNNSNHLSTTATTTHIEPIPVFYKRTGAHANRYQLFYDNSYKISNALKSSETINIPMNKMSQKSNLEHSCSLPILKGRIPNEQQQPKISKNHFASLSNDSNLISSNLNEISPIISPKSTDNEFNNDSPASVSTESEQYSSNSEIKSDYKIDDQEDTPVTDTKSILKPIIKINNHEIHANEEFNNVSAERENDKLNDCLKILKITKIPNFKSHKKSSSLNYFKNFQTTSNQRHNHQRELSVSSKSETIDHRDNLSLRSLNWTSASHSNANNSDTSKKSKFVKWLKSKK